MKKNNLKQLLIAVSITTAFIPVVSSNASENAYLKDIQIIDTEKASTVIKESIKLSNKSKISNSKIGPKIAKLMAKPDLLESATSRTLTRTKEQSKVHVYIKVHSTEVVQTDLLTSFGLEIEIINDNLKKIQGWIKLDDIEKLSELENVLIITAPVYGHSRVGSRLTEGDSILNSDAVRALGFTGRDVRVGIISTGSIGLATSQSTNDLPDDVTTFGTCFGPASVCSEGTAMAEIIHDIAPEAELAIGATNSSLDFIQRLSDLQNNFNADIIVDDIGFFGLPIFEDDDVAQAVNALADNIVYISAAGNDADIHYESNFILDADGSSFHDFGASANSDPAIFMAFIVLPGDEACTLLQWNDPFFSPVNDFNLQIFSLIDGEIELQDPGDEVEEIFSRREVCVTNTTNELATFLATVNLVSGNSSNSFLEMFFLDSAAIQFPVTQGSIFGHPATARAIAVGAIDAADPGNDDIKFFSSQGPSRVDFPVQQTRAKPDITGIDGVSVTGAGGFPSIFTGTSAAAPHIAGIAALLKSANPSASPEDIRDALTQGATDLGDSGFDSVFGNGRANATNSVELIQTQFDILDFIPSIINSAVQNRDSK